MFPLPDAFLDSARKMLGDEYPAFLRAMDAPPALALRLNPRRTGAERAAREYIEAPVPWARDGYYLRRHEGLRPGSTVAHAAGAYYLQEASAMASAAVLDAQPGERVLDLCAAPGGKSTQIAAVMRDAGLLVSNDPDSARATALAGNLERFGAANAVVVSALPAKLADRWPGYFDAVLVDAPCSGEGMFRREPAARVEWNPAAPEGCAKRQAEILDQAARLVRPGGRLVYSTCTFNALENEGSVLGFLGRHGDFVPEDFALPGVGVSRDGMLRLWPHRLRGDGHFVARLRRAGESVSPPKGPSRVSDKALFTYLAALEREIGALPECVRDMRLFMAGDRLFCQRADCPPLNGIRLISPGLCLARVGRSHIEPEHALAMTLSPEQAFRRADLSEEQARAWLRGEALVLDGEKGWTLVTFSDMPLSWGKRSEGTLKNHLPKGLRRG